MIQIRYSPEAFRLELNGHAGSAPAGSDLVCCSASTLLFTLYNHLLERGIDIDSELDNISGHALIIAKPKEDEMHDCSIMFDLIYEGLRDLADEYGDYAKLSEKGV